DALRRQLHFLNSLKDQYSAAMIVLPGDVPLNRMLRESQIPHRPVEHPVAQAKPYTRMQIRVLDHKKFLEAMKLTDSTRGAAIIAERATEGAVSKFHLDINDGLVSVSKTDASAEVECTDVQWVSIASGDLSAADAARF